MTNTHGGARPGAGRKAPAVQKVRYQVTLTERAAAILRCLGGGNLSQGAELAADHIDNEQPAYMTPTELRKAQDEKNNAARTVLDVLSNLK